MNRRNAERLSADSHDLSSKQRIVRRKVHRSPSPPLSRSAREVRTSSSDIYSKIGQSHHSNKYMEYRRSTGDLRDERLGGSKDRGYAPRHANIENHGDIRGSDGRGIGSNIKRSTSSEISGSHRSLAPFHESKYDKFEYSLHVCNLNSKLTDGETKINLFRQFKKYGFVNIKVIGYGKDRHAFINFTRLDDARTALSELDNTSFFGQNIEVTWSRSTLNRYPELGRNLHSEQRGGGGAGGVVKSRSFQQHESSLDFFNQSGGRNSDHFQDSPHSSRALTYHHHRRSPSPPPPSSSSASSRNHALHSAGAKEVPIKASPAPGPGAILDPNATRTLFVGSLESDVTERELRDLFSPYGRIESVDIKVQRSISTAYAFVKFYTITDAMAAKKYMHGRKYGNTKLKIGFGKGSPSAKVWVGNLTGFADLTEVRTELDRFGLIRRVDYNNGDNHAFVHFDSLDAAQAAVSSLTTYRFRSTNRPLKIDLSQPVPRADSDFEDDFDFHEAVVAQNSGGGSGGRQVRSRMSPEIGSNSVLSRRGAAGSRVGRSDSFSRNISRGDSPIGHHMGVSDISTSYRPTRGRRVVTELQDSAHRASPGNSGLSYSEERNGFRKRDRSPTMNEGLDMGDRDYHRTGSFGQHLERGGSNPDRNRIGSSGTHSGDYDFRAKRPRNGFDAYQYHKMHGGSRGAMGGIGRRVGSTSSHGSDRDRDYRDREFRGHADARSRERRDERREREGERERAERGSSVKSEHKEGSERNSRRHTPSESAVGDNDGGGANNNNIEKISPPPPPPPPPIIEMMSYETSDPALKLGEDGPSPGHTSPSDGNQPGSKADFKVESLSDMSRVYPVVWHGNLVLKNTGFPTRMHLIGGDPTVAELLVRCKDQRDDSDSLRITQRLRLEPPRLEEVNKRMTSAGPGGHCILLALPGAIPTQSAGEDSESANSAIQLRPLKSLVSYLEQKEAAGIVALSATDVTSGGGAQPRDGIIGVLHAFPPCEFSQNQLLKIAPNLGNEPAKEDHVVVLLVKGTV